MLDDEVIREVRRIRDEIAAQFNYDVRAIGAYYIKLQQESGLPTVSLAPRKPVPTPRTTLANKQNGNGAKPAPQFGSARGVVSLADDFAEPLAEFEEYTR